MKHVVTLTISNPSHEHLALRRSQKTTNYIVEARDEEEAIFRASNHFRKLGNYVHEAKVAKPLTEETVSENAEQVNEFFGIFSAAGKAATAARAATTASKAISKAAAPTKVAVPAVKAPVRTLPAPAPVRTLPVPAPAPVRLPTPAPAPVRTLPAPAPAPVRTMPAPAPAPVRLPVPTKTPAPAPVKLPVPAKAPVRTMPAPAPARTLPAPAPAPVKLPVPTRAPAPAPVRTLPAPAPAPVRTMPAPTKLPAPTKVTTATKPISPLVGAATVATGLNFLLNRPKVKPETEVETEVETEKLPQTQPQPQTKPDQVPEKVPETKPEVPRTTNVPQTATQAEPETVAVPPQAQPLAGAELAVPATVAAATVAARSRPGAIPSLDLGLSGGLDDSRFLSWIRAGRSLSARQEMYEESHTEDARKKAVTRVLEKRMKSKEEEMKGEKNKINMEPTLKTKGGLHHAKV